MTLNQWLLIGLILFGWAGALIWVKNPTPDRPGLSDVLLGMGLFYFFIVVGPVLILKVVF